MSITSLLKLLALSSALTLTACGGSEDTTDTGTGGTEQPSDRDGDGVADTEDDFPDDSSETKDSDGDGVGDNADWAVNDSSEQSDSDGDGVGDNADWAVNDSSEQFDSDGDGVGDNADFDPNDSSVQIDPNVGSGGDGTTNVLSFNLSGAVSVVTTDNSATQTSGDGNSVGSVVSAMSNKGRKLNTFVFHELPANGNKLSKKDKSRNIQAAGYSAKDAVKFADDSTSNFFVIDENGDLQFAAESDFDIKVSYSVVWDEVSIVEEPDPIVEGATIETEVVTPYLFFAVDVEDFWSSSEFIFATGGCALFKVNVDTADWSCVEIGYAASGIDDSYRKTMSDQKRKPLQIDKDGNVFFIAKQFNMVDNDGDEIADFVEQPENWWQTQTLRKVNIDEAEGRDLTPDNFYVESYMAMPNDTVTYTAQDSLSNGQRVLKMVKNASLDNPETIDLEDNVPWGDFFYAKDDANTVMYSDSNGWGNGIQFTQPRTGGLRGRFSLELDTAIFSDSDWNVSPKRIILADDGSMYGLFVEESYNDNEATFTGKLKRMLPYSPATFASFVIGNDWEDYWQFFDNGQRDVQVAKGFAYYIEEKRHTFNGERSVIRAVRLADGKRINLLEDDEWEQTYELYNWKLNGDNIYFTGFDKFKSVSISGRIDTVLMKQGAEESEYLTITETSSVLGSSGKIDDLEVLRGAASDTFTGGNPQVVKYFTDQENMYSASVEFNKYMDIDSVNDGTTVSVTNTDEEGVETTVAIESDSDGDSIQDGIVLKVWLNRTMHLIFDTFIDTSDDPDVSTQPLSTASQYTINIDEEALDNEGFALISGSSVLDWTWSTRPTSGWYQGISGAVVGITDGTVGKFAAKNDNDFTESTLAELGYPLNVKVEYSMPSSTPHRAELYLRDSHQVDWSNVESNPTDADENQWTWNDGFEVLRDGSMAVKWQWVDDADWRAAWRQDKAYKIAQPIIAVDSDDDTVDDLFYLDPVADNEVTYVQIPWHLYDEDNEEFYSEFWVTDSSGDSILYRRNLGSDPLTPDADGILYTETSDYYMEEGSTEKFYYDHDPEVQDYVDSEGNVIDWSKEITYFSWSWEDENGNRNELSLDWRNGYWVNIADGAIPEVDLDDTAWQQSYYGSDINEDTFINLAGLCQFGGPKDDLGVCTNLSDASAEAGEEYQFNGTWDWAAVFDEDDFVASNDDYRWFAYSSHGGWNCCSEDRIELLGLDSSNPDWFSHDWEGQERVENGWSVKEWVRFEYTIVTDQTGDNDITTITLNIYDLEGVVIQTVEKELFMDVKEASWSAFTGVEGYENSGFNLDFRLSGGDAIIDNLIVTDMSGDTDEILVNDTFDSGANIFTTQSNVSSTSSAAAFNKKVARK